MKTFLRAESARARGVSPHLLAGLMVLLSSRIGLAEARKPVGDLASGQAGNVIEDQFTLGCINHGGTAGTNLVGTCANGCSDVPGVKAGEGPVTCALFARGDFTRCMDSACNDANRTFLDERGYRKVVDDRPVSGSINLDDVWRCVSEIGKSLKGMHRGRVACGAESKSFGEVCGGENLSKFTLEVIQGYLEERKKFDGNDWCKYNLVSFFAPRGGRGVSSENTISGVLRNLRNDKAVDH